jgi:hypothetical protein
MVIVAGAKPRVKRTMSMCVRRRVWVFVGKSAIAVATPEAVDGGQCLLGVCFSGEGMGQGEQRWRVGGVPGVRKRAMGGELICVLVVIM